MSEPVDPTIDTESPPSSMEAVTISRAQFEAIRRALLESPHPQREVGPSDPAASTGPTASPPSGEAASRDRRIAELEALCKAAIRERELATALVGRPLAGGAAAQLVKLWRDEFDVFEENGTYRVAARDGRSVAEAVGEWLASADYAHFCLPSSRGGSGARDASRPASPAPGQNPPKNLGEAVVMRWREESAAKAEGLLKPIGLRRHR